MDFDCPAAGSLDGSSSRAAPEDPSSSSPTGESRQSDAGLSAPTIWFPLNENVSSSWPPKITFGSPHATSHRKKSPQSSLTPSPNAMEGVITPPPQSTRTGHSRSATRAIPNRTSRSNSLSVPATPTSLWRGIPEAKSFTRGLVSDACSDAPSTTSGRIRPFPSFIELEPKTLYCPSRHASGDVRCNTRPAPLALPPPLAMYPSTSPTGSQHSVLTQWSQDERAFRHLCEVQRRKTPRLPLIVSPFNPLRAFMPPLYWNTVAAKMPPLPKVKWNFTKPLPSPALRPKLHSRKACDPYAERLSAKAIFTGTIPPRCRICSQDTLLKRLLLFNHWAARADFIFESALSLILPDDYEMEYDSSPKGVLLKDRDDFDDADRAMDETPLIAERPADTYSLPLPLF
ncbi:hypothetical protein FB451DRAFT_1252506 [Mycena latifolia]|nr:hypothetical protein FB451DRAFT_1252506 [Mycena latifolia]